jgi:hypothetical protein
VPQTYVDFEGCPQNLSGETWQEFSEWLSHFREKILYICTAHQSMNYAGWEDIYPADWVDGKQVEELRAHLSKLCPARGGGMVAY